MAFSALEALQAFGMGRQLAQQDRQVSTRQDASQMAATGDFTGAANTALSGGEVGLAGQFRQLGQAEREQGLQEAQIIAGEAAILRRLPVEQRASAFAAIRPQLQQLGFFSPQELDAVTDFSDTALDGYIRTGERALRILQPRSGQPTPFQQDLAAAGIQAGTPQFRTMLENRYAPPAIPVRNDDGTTTLYPRPTAPVPPTYQDGETRIINNIPYVRQGGVWVPQTAAPAPTGDAPPEGAAPASSTGWPAPVLEDRSGDYPVSRGAVPANNIPRGNPLDPGMANDGPNPGGGFEGVGGPYEAAQPTLTDADIAQSEAPQQQQGSYTVGTPSRTRQAEEARQAAADRRAEEANRRAAGADARSAAADARTAQAIPSGYRRAANGNLEPIPGGPADTTARTRQLPQPAFDRLADGTSTVTSLRRIISNFNPNYAGNVLGGAENLMQRTIGGGTPGQNQWWSDVGAMDNVARNALFGASLTQGEKDAWEATTVNPRMTAGEVRTNLRRRLEIASAALRRAARSNAANGYNREAIGEALGDLRGMLEDRPPSDTSSPLAGTPQANRQQLIDLMDQAPPGSTARFRLLESYAQYRREEPRPVRVAVVDTGGEEPVDGMGVSLADGARLLEEYERERPLQAARDSREQFAAEQPVLAAVDTTVRAGANALTLGFADKIAGGMNGTGTEVEHAITRSDWENRAPLALGGTLAGGLVLPVGRTIPRQIGLGTLYGGTYGYNSGEGTLSDTLTGAGLGAGVASLVSLGLRAAGRGGGGPSNPELVQAAERQGVDILAADAAGTAVQRVTGGTGQTIFGSGPVIRQAVRANNQAGGRVAEIANDAAAPGIPARREALGTIATRGAERYIDESGQIGRSLYEEAGDLSHDVIAQAPRAFRNINAQIRELGPTAATEGDLIPALTRLRSVIADESGLRPLDVQAMRRLRTTVSNEARSDALRNIGDYKARAGQVLENLRDDIAASLSPDARRAFLAADRQWAERLDTVDDVMRGIIGREGERSPEAVAGRLAQMSRGDSARLGRFLDAIPAEEAAVVRGSLISELGRAVDSQQGAAGNRFSLDTFLTNWNRIRDTHTPNLLFRGEAREAIEDIATIAEHAKATARFGNTSNTAGATNVSNAIQHVSGYAAFGSLGLTAIAENLTGRLLASRRFLRVFANMPKEPGRAIRAMQRVAVAEPAISQDIGRLIQAVQGTGQDLAPAVSSAAADERQDRR